MNSDSVILAIDLGTTGNRTIAFTPSGTIAAQSYRKLTQHYPQPGWVEHNPIELYQTCKETIEEVIAAVGIENIHAAGITNQRETTIIWERSNGRPVYPAIVWQDRRTAPECATFTDAKNMVKEKTGLIVDPYFSATKIAWILDKVDPKRKRCTRGELLFGTPETWVLWNLTGGAIHATEPSNASRTMLYNIITQQWDDELLKLFRIPFTILPTVYDSDSLFGATEFTLFGKNFPIHGIAGDQQASLFGQLGWDSNTVKTTYGTGIFMLTNTGETAATTDNLITTVAWKRNKTLHYATEGSLFMGGASIEWLQKNLGIISTPGETGSETIAQTDSDGVFFIPAFQGLGAPYWKPDARAQLIGMSLKADKSTLIRAAVESMAFQVRDIIEAMKDADIPLPQQIRADGGASRNDVLMQFQADLLGIPVVCPALSETTAYGIAGIAGIASGFWTDDSFASTVSETKHYTPAFATDNNPLDEKYGQWKKAVGQCLLWSEK